MGPAKAGLFSLLSLLEKQSRGKNGKVFSAIGRSWLRLQPDLEPE
jgi:hypothetical protein